MISRRAFIGLLAGAGVAGIGGSLDPRLRALAGSPGIRTIQLETRSVSWELAPGRTIKAMAYNGRVPGPELRVREGERMGIVLKNLLGEPTTIHWHGVDVPNPMDGVPDITQKPVQPGETFVYEFEARPAGTRWYHTHVQEHRQMDLGLAAPLIIEATAPEPMPYDRELTLVLDDWVTGAGDVLPSTREGTAGGRGSMGGMMGGMMRGGGMMGGVRGGPAAMREMMRRGLAWTLNDVAADSHAPDPLFTIDTRPYSASLAAAQAELSRNQALAEEATVEAERAQALLKEGLTTAQEAAKRASASSSA